jgi:hypothetical protein
VNFPTSLFGSVCIYVYTSTTLQPRSNALYKSERGRKETRNIVNIRKKEEEK